MKDRRYTLPATDELCRVLAEVEAWDVDLAGEPGHHLAPRWYGPGSPWAEDALALPFWFGWEGRCWCNPPWTDVVPWVRQAWARWQRRQPGFVLAMLLPANRTEQPWWQHLVEPGLHHGALKLHHLPGRVRYGSPAHPGGVPGAPPFGSLLLVWRTE